LDDKQGFGVGVRGEGGERGVEFRLGVQVGQGVAEAGDDVEADAESDGSQIVDTQIKMGSGSSSVVNHGGLQVNPDGYQMRGDAGEVGEVSTGAAAKIQQRGRVGRAVGADELGDEFRAA